MNAHAYTSGDANQRPHCFQAPTILSVRKIGKPKDSRKLSSASTSSEISKSILFKQIATSSSAAAWPQDIGQEIGIERRCGPLPPHGCRQDSVFALIVATTKFARALKPRRIYRQSQASSHIAVTNDRTLAAK